MNLKSTVYRLITATNKYFHSLCTSLIVLIIPSTTICLVDKLNQRDTSRKT